MSEKETVALANYGAGRKDYHESLKYLRVQEKVAPKYKRLAMFLGVVAIIIIVFKRAPEQQVANDSTQTAMSPPSIDGSQPQIDLSMYNRGSAARSFGSIPKGKPGQALRLLGPKLIARTNKIKIPPGSEAKAILVTGASNGLVKVKLREDVTVAGEVFLNSGTLLVGTGSSTEDKLFVHFTRAILEDGTVSTIEAEIADASDATVGLKGSFLSTHAARIAAGAGLNFIAGASVALQDTQGQQGAVVTKPTIRNAILSGTARAALEESNGIASKYKNSPPAIEIKAGTEVKVIFTESGG